MAALLARGADVRREGPSGQTALHFAAFGGGALVARTLVAAGADPRALNDIGDTPADVARYKSRVCGAAVYLSESYINNTSKGGTAFSNRDILILSYWHIEMWSVHNN